MTCSSSQLEVHDSSDSSTNSKAKYHITYVTLIQTCIVHVVHRDYNNIMIQKLTYYKQFKIQRTYKVIVLVRILYIEIDISDFVNFQSQCRFCVKQLHTQSNPALSGVVEFKHSSALRLSSGKPLTCATVVAFQGVLILLLSCCSCQGLLLLKQLPRRCFQVCW